MELAVAGLGWKQERVKAGLWSGGEFDFSEAVVCARLPILRAIVSLATAVLLLARVAR
jgi:hypothetical protein